MLYLPTLNAVLNTSCFLCLVAGYVAIKKNNKKLHAICMLLGFSFSAAFLVSYLIYHYHVGSVKFLGEGWIRPFYFSLLLSHTILAVVMVPMVIKTLYHAATKNFTKHKIIARWTWPVWIYVSVTGVVIYLILYQGPWPRGG